MVDEIALAVRPPRGIAIVLTERPYKTQNWLAATGVMDLDRTNKFSATVAALRKSDPVIDWSAVSETGRRQAPRGEVAV